MLSKAIPCDSPLHRHVKWAYQDLRTLSRTFVPWEHMENLPPRQLSIETTNICNANCIFCAYRFQEDFRPGKGVMSDDLFQRILREYAELGGRAVSFTPLVGEPLVDKDIISRVAQVIRHGFELGFHTNGILLDKMNIEALLATGIRSMFLSTAPLDEECHERLYHSGRYPDLLAGIRRLLETRNRLGAPLRVTFHFRSDVSAEHALGFPDYRDIICPLMMPEERANVGILLTGYDSWGGHIAASDLTGEMKLGIPPRLKYRPCAHTFAPQVLWDGKVRACACFFGRGETIDSDDGLCVGDLNEESLSEVWHGERLRRLRRRFMAGNLPGLCKRCTNYRSC